MISRFDVRTCVCSWSFLVLGFCADRSRVIFSSAFIFIVFDFNVFCVSRCIPW